MIGGDEASSGASTLFSPAGPKHRAAPRTPAGESRRTAEHGYLHCARAARATSQDVHNGIEYGIMAAYAEG